MVERDASRSTCLAPNSLPPFRRDNVHALLDVGDVPSGQRRQRQCFALLAVGQRPAVRVGSFAAVRAGPRMAKDIAALEIRAIGGLLKDEVLREMPRVIPDVEARDEDVTGTSELAPIGLVAVIGPTWVCRT